MVDRYREDGKDLQDDKAKKLALVRLRFLEMAMLFWQADWKNVISGARSALSLLDELLADEQDEGQKTYLTRTVAKMKWGYSESLSHTGCHR